MVVVQKLSACLKTVFAEAPKEANEKARVILRERKFTASSLALSHILAFLANPRAGVNEIAAMACLLGSAVTPEALYPRYTAKLTEFFKLLFGNMSQIAFGSNKELAPFLSRFSSVSLLDSTVIALPASMTNEFPGCGGTGNSNMAAVKIQTEMDLRTGALTFIQTEAGKSPDQATSRLKDMPAPGSLRIADLGYFSIETLKMIALAAAFFISRIQQTVIVHANGKRATIVDFLRQRNEDLVDMPVRIGENNTMECRLIAWRVPSEIAQRRIKALKKRLLKKGRQPSEQAIAACDWNYLVTNLPPEQLTVKEAITMYRSRWQIELLFKRWKSHCGVAILDGTTDEMTMTRLWARLCAALVQQWFVAFAGWTSNGPVPSFTKIARSIRFIVKALAICLGERKPLKPYLERFRQMVTKLCRRSKRSKKPGTFELLLDANCLEFALT